MTPPHEPWNRLVAAARSAPAEARADHPPYGFATRVAALAFERVERPLWGLYERFSWRALGLAAGLAVASAVLNVAPALQAFNDDDLIVDDDPVALVFDLL
jgi:hypothetical protein